VNNPPSTDRSYWRLHLLYQLTLVSVGFIAFAIAAIPDCAALLIAFAAGCGLIASAFTQLPKAIAGRLRTNLGNRPNYEAVYAVGGGIFLVLVFAWWTIDSARQLDYLSYFDAPRWYDTARPLIFGAMLVMNLGGLAAIVISLARERRKPA